MQYTKEEWETFKQKLRVPIKEENWVKLRGFFDKEERVSRNKGPIIKEFKTLSAEELIQLLFHNWKWSNLFGGKDRETRRIFIIQEGKSMETLNPFKEFLLLVSGFEYECHKWDIYFYIPDP